MMHLIVLAKVTGDEFASVQKMDPYFASTEEIKTVPEFIDNKNMLL